MEGLAAGSITLNSFLNPLSSSVDALSRYRLSMVIMPVMVAKRVDQKEPYTMRNMDAALKVGANSRAKGERSMEGITLKAYMTGCNASLIFACRPSRVPMERATTMEMIMDGIIMPIEDTRFTSILSLLS